MGFLKKLKLLLLELEGGRGEYSLLELLLLLWEGPEGRGGGPGGVLWGLGGAGLLAQPLQSPLDLWGNWGWCWQHVAGYLE